MRAVASLQHHAHDQLCASTLRHNDNLLTLETINVIMYTLLSLFVYCYVISEEIIHFARKSFDENGDEQVEQDVVAERHEEDEVQGGPRRRPRHSRV